MDDLYGKTGSKGLTTAQPDAAKTHRNTFNTSGRLTPIGLANPLSNPLETPSSSKAQNRQAAGSFPHNSSMSGRLTPIDTAVKAGRQPAGPGLLNVSSHNSSKLSGSHSGSNQTKTTFDSSHHELNSTQISPISATRRPLVDTSSSSQHNGGPKMANGGPNSTKKKQNVSQLMLLTTEAGVKEMIQSLGLIALVSLLLALGSLVFLLKIIPDGSEIGKKTHESETGVNFLTVEESVTVYQVTVAMCALTLSLNLSCLLVCAIQFLFAAKLVKSSNGRLRTTKYLKKASLTRTCAIGGFFLSIPLFLIGIVLFTFLHFNETPAIVTSVVIGLGIVFCGGAVIHNVFVWQREKTVITKGNGTILNSTTTKELYKRASILGQSHIVLPHATLDLSNGFNGTITAKSLELSTLV